MTTSAQTPLPGLPHPAETIRIAETGQIINFRHEVGSQAIYVVGVEGTVSEKTDETITIAGITLPRRMGAGNEPGKGVRYLSMLWPDENHDDCCPHTDSPSDDDAYEEGYAAADKAWVALVRAEHETHPGRMHDGAFRFCNHPLCVAAHRAERVR